MINQKFLSTLSLRRATPNPVCIMITIIISIHALLAESDVGVFSCYLDNIISIHALLAESDETVMNDIVFVPGFLSTLSLRRATISSKTAEIAKTSFLSTLSLRRATTRILLSLTYHQHFYPRSPCGERLTSEVSERVPLAISIHALLAESDGKSQSSGAGIGISIHALLAESDTVTRYQL